MRKYFEIFIDQTVEYWNYLLDAVLDPAWDNFFYWLIGISVFVYVLELLFPWRMDQDKVRKDFWLDTFYMFFNVFLFSLIGFNGLSGVGVELFNDGLQAIGIGNGIAIEIGGLPTWLKIGFAFLLKDFLSYLTHRWLHRSNFLWQFHKVHHSVKQMGYAAHLRYHWMENVVYASVLYIPMAMLGFGINDYIAAHLIALTIGHFNHANLYLPIGPLKYVLNNPQMHIWHHAKELPQRFGSNFGISLSIWDYLLGTNYVPSNGRDIELGFPGDENFPSDFLRQEVYPLLKK